ncbi:hypothetical protein VJY32_00150 [Ignavibacteria bacterium 4148-Me]|uniref:hypothetical protein n=1 Tax=Rosettibacter primus TaxID=3111523 RepID=UPI00336BE960
MKLRNEVFLILLETLNKYDYCFLRNYEILPEYNNDIDILVKNGTTNEILKNLIEELQAEEVVFVYEAQFSCLSTYFYDLKTDQFIHLDFFEEIKWKVFEYLPANEVLKNRVKYNYYYIPSPYYEMYELLLTRLLYHGRIKDVYKDRIFKLYNRIISEITFNNKIKFGDKIASQSWDKIEKKITQIRARIIICNILKPIKLSKHIILLLQRIIKRLIKPPGLFIAFYGVDGSGKTTQIKLMLDYFKGIYSDKVRLFHFRPNFIYTKPKDIIVKNPHNQLKTNYIRSFLKLLYYVLVYNWGYLTQVLPIIAKNGLVIFDRYYFDLLIDPIRYRTIIPKLFIKICGIFVPKPDINICLIANAQIINERKNEINLIEIEEQQKRIKEFFCNDNDYLVKSDIEILKTAEQIKQIIIKNVRKKN